MTNMENCFASVDLLLKQTFGWIRVTILLTWDVGQFCDGSSYQSSYTVTFRSHFPSYLILDLIFLGLRKTGLVGGIPTPLKNMSSSVGIIIPNTLWLFNIAMV